MISIKLITVSKIKPGPWLNLVEEYLKRLQPYAKVEVIEISEHKFRDKSERDQVRRAEAEKIQKHIPKDAVTIACDETGREFTSEEFAGVLTDWSENNQDQLVFIIGGPLGLDHELVSSCDHQLSLSKMTLPHDEARVFLLEQLYRAMTIQNNKTYHY